VRDYYIIGGLILVLAAAGVTWAWWFEKREMRRERERGH